MDSIMVWLCYRGRDGKLYPNHGLRYEGEQAEILRIAYGLTDNVYYRELR